MRVRGNGRARDTRVSPCVSPSATSFSLEAPARQATWLNAFFQSIKINTYIVRRDWYLH